MATNWDRDMQERFEKVEGAVDEFRKRFDAVDARFDAVDARLDKVDARFDKVDARLDKMDARFDEMARNFDEREDRIVNMFKVHFENMRDSVQKALEGFSATLEAVARRLEETRDESHITWRGHEAVLKNHAVRITALERRKKG